MPKNKLKPRVPYAERMEHMVSELAANFKDSDNAPKLLAGTGKDLVHLLVAFTSHRGLCGGFNSSIVKAVKARIRQLQSDGRRVKLLCIGKKGEEQLKRDFGNLMLTVPFALKETGKRGVSYSDSENISQHIFALLDQVEFDVCTIYYNTFKSAISQEVTEQQLIPLALPESTEQQSVSENQAKHEYEPGEKTYSTVFSHKISTYKSTTRCSKTLQVSKARA